ncbi:MAG: trypsin-like peptidase domain-containing protein [Candidatus Marinimicrobia bacterium]|nr:trypsin-like peptidase domain-containing protein [Candidatus Neomarinimicrobiota bacterium]
MSRIDPLFGAQIEGTEARYEGRSAGQNQRQADMKLGGDWRKVETPQRVLHRMAALGLNQLAGSVMGAESVTQGVDSAVRVGAKVSLLERIMEENDLLSVRFLHRGSSLARSVGRVLIRRRGRTIGFGTGFLVSPQLMMTNHHVLDTAGSAAESRIEFDFYERRGGQTGPTVLFDLEPENFFLTSKPLDFTLIAVAARAEGGQQRAARGWIPLIAESGKALVGEPVNIIQHPGGAPQQIALRNNQIVDRVEDYLHYVADTEPGSSGSPVFSMQWELAALHHSGVPERDDRGRILLRDQSVWDGSRDSQDRIAWKANEGVRISSIVRAVQAALVDRPARDLGLFEEALGPAPSERTPPAPVYVAPSAATRIETFEQAMALDDATLDSLSPEATAAILAQLEDPAFDLSLDEAHRGTWLVAEGDSWFDYSIGGFDIIDYLKWHHGYRIKNISQAGDTLDNMAWGTEYDRNWNPKPPPLDETLEAVRKYRPSIVLLSGGGNDIAGPEFLSLLNHKQSGQQQPLRQPFTDFVLKTYFLKAYEKIIDSIWKIDRKIEIITHGYGYGLPNGLGAIRILGHAFVGPWLRPALSAKGYFLKQERRAIVREVMDGFNEMLAALAAGDNRIHYIDLRGEIKESEWENELHLSNSGYRRMARKFDAKIRSILA